MRSLRRFQIAVKPVEMTLQTDDFARQGAGVVANTVPKGAACFPLRTSGRAMSFQFLILPDFTLSAFACALDTLRIANQLAQKPLFHWTILSQDGGPVRASCGLEIPAQASVANLDQDSHLIVCSGNNGATAACAASLSAIRGHARFGGRIGGLCSGATTLARAGLLAGKRFTLHWENQPAFREMFPDLTPSARNFEVDGDLLTCGGGGASADMLLHVIEREFGRRFAQVVGDMCLRRTGKPQPQRTPLALALNTRNPRVIEIVKVMQDNIENPYSLDALADKTGYSRRQIERLFRAYVNNTPSVFYKNLRLDRARCLVVETNMTVSEIAAATGFASSAHFAKLFRERFGHSPSGPQ